MKPAPFDMVRPDTIEEVLNVLSEDENAKLLAGGQSLVPLMNLRMSTPSLLIDLNRVRGLSGVELHTDSLRIGAMTRQATLLSDALVSKHAPLLREATANIGHVQTRNRGTLGGSLAHADPAAELPLAALTLDVTVVAMSKRGARQIPASSFFIDVFTTSLQSDELLTEIRIPLTEQSVSRVAFHEYTARHGDFAIASAAVQRIDDRRGSRFRVAVGGIATAPFFCAKLSNQLGKGAADAATVHSWIAAELDSLDAMSDLQASADYRRRLGTLALIECLQKVMAP